MNGNGKVPRALREALDLAVAENRLLRAQAQRQRAVPPAPTVRHCGFCGSRVCECGLEGWVGG